MTMHSVKLVSTRQAATLHGIKVLVYGGAGVGKTVLTSTAPQPVLFSAESGLLSLRHKDVPVWEINTIDDLAAGYTWAAQSQEARQFHTVCLDSVSEIAEKCLANLRSDKKDPRQAYGELIDRMGAILRDFRDLPNYHVYFSAKLERYKDEQSGIIRAQPSMPGTKLGPSLPYMFDEVFRMGIGESQDGTRFRYLQTQPDLYHEAKDRSGSLEPYEPPDLTHVFNKILGVK